MHGISYRPTDLSSLKEFLKISIILFEQDCPEAVVHEPVQQSRQQALRK